MRPAIDIVTVAGHSVVERPVPSRSTEAVVFPGSTRRRGRGLGQRRSWVIAIPSTKARKASLLDVNADTTQGQIVVTLRRPEMDLVGMPELVAAR